MRLLIILFVTQFFVLRGISQNTLLVRYSNDTIYAKSTASIDSVKLDSTFAKFKSSGSANALPINKAVIDSITFTTSTVNTGNKIYIIYNGANNATIINPYAGAGVSITATGGTVNVTATSGIANLEYNILGSSANGSLTMATDKDVNLILNNLTLTNPGGAAFFITGGKITNLLPKPGTINLLADGTASTKNGTIHTDGPIVIASTGTLSINGIKRHGINTTSTIDIQSGTTTITNAANDGLHSEGFTMSAGTLNVNASVGDGVDAGNAAVSVSGGTIAITSTVADVRAIKTGTGTINISGGNFTLSVSGAQSKAITAKGNITITNGTIGITLSGATVLTASGSGFDPSYCTGIKTDGVLTVSGGTFNIQATSTADGGRGFSSDGITNITGGTITINTAGNGANYTNILGVADSYSTAGFSCKTTINISGGTQTITNTGTNGKGISTDKVANISGTAQLTITNNGNAGKCIKSDSIVVFNGGNTILNVNGAIVLTPKGSGFDPSYPTGVKAVKEIIVNSGNLTINGGTTATGTKGLSSDATVTTNGGTINITTQGNGATYTNSTGILDSYSSAAISTDTHLFLNAGNLTTSSSGSGGKGLKVDGNVTVGTATTSPVLNITTTGARFLVSGTNYTHPKTLVAAGIITITNGNNTFTSTDDGIHSDSIININGGTNKVTAISTVQSMGEGIEAPKININGGVNDVTASNDGINATYGTVAGGINTNDGSLFKITGGITTVNGKDGVDSNGDMLMTGGTLIVNGPTAAPEEALDFNGTFVMNGGLVIAGGSNSGMTPNFSAASAQRTMFLKSTAQLPTNALLHIRTSTGTELVTFKPLNAVYYFHYSSSSIAPSTSYQVYFGGTYTGGNFVGNSVGWGLYTGGTYSTTGATLKTTFTTSATSSLNTVNF